MMRNDYRRALIMLRPHEQGYSGHVRLERRTLMDSMYFVIGAPPESGELCAALIRRSAEGEYAASRIGTLRRDGRGQAGLSYTFDPRSIDGFALEDYILIAVVSRIGKSCSLVMTGNVNGSREVSLGDVQQAACGACTEETLPDCGACLPPVSAPPKPVCPKNTAPEPDGGLQRFSEEDSVALPEEPGGNDAAQKRPAKADSEAGAEEPDEGDGMPEIVVLPDVEMQSEPEEMILLTGETEPMPGQPAYADDGEQESVERTAAQALGMDAQKPWPGTSEQVRMLFARLPVRELMLGDGYTYVRAPMPVGSGYDHVDVGVRLEDGAPRSIAYALPDRFSPEPPPGLEGYRWYGGASEGWWVLRTDAETGERLTEAR